MVHQVNLLRGLKTCERLHQKVRQRMFSSVEALKRVFDLLDVYLLFKQVEGVAGLWLLIAVPR